MRVVARWVPVLVVTAVLAVAGSWQAGGAGAQGTPVFSVTPAQQTVDLSAGTVTVSIKIADVPAVQAYAKGLGSFGFTLRYDAGVLSEPVPQAADFLGSTGRQIQCLPPVIDGAGAGTLQYGCGSLGSGSGPVGAGTVATVTFHLAGGSGTTIVVEKATAADPSSLPLCRTDGFGNDAVGNDYLLTCAASGAAVTVKDGNAALNQGLSASPTPVPTRPASVSEPAQGGNTPAAVAPSGTDGTPQAGASTSQGEVTPAASGSDVSPAPVSRVAGAAISGGTGVVSGAASTNVGRYGVGTVQRHRGGELAGIILVAALAGLLSCSAAMRLRYR